MWTLGVTLNAEVVAAFLTGVASILSAGFAVKRARKDERARCEERIKEIREIYREKG